MMLEKVYLIIASSRYKIDTLVSLDVYEPLRRTSTGARLPASHRRVRPTLSLQIE